MSGCPGTSAVCCGALARRGGGRRALARFEEESSGGTSRVMGGIINGNRGIGAGDRFWGRREGSQRLQVEHIEEETREEEVNYQDPDGGDDYGAGCSAAYALGAAADAQAAVTTYGGDD